MRRALDWVDLPPVWLIGFLFVTWQQARVWPGPAALHAAGGLAGGLLIGGGVILVALAVSEMRAQKTTVIPHRTPRALVQSGIFRRSRNPIYLADLLFLAGFALATGAWPSLVLVPLLGWLLTDRFILPEEARLAETFGPAFDAYAARTRRWI